MGEEEKDIFLYLQIQFMQVFNKVSRNDDESMASELHTISVDEDEEQIELSSYQQEIFSMQTNIKVDKGMDADNLNVVVNGFPMEKDVYAYDSQTGDLVVAVSPASVNSIEVTEDENALSDELLEFMEKSEAALGLSSGAGMPSKTSVKVDSLDDIPTEGCGGTSDGTDASNFIAALLNNTDTTWYNSVAMNNPFTVHFAQTSDAVEFAAFLKQIGDVGAACAHVHAPLEGFGDNNYQSYMPPGLDFGAGKIYVRVLDRQDNKPERGKATGYIVLGFVTRKAGGQSGNAAIRIDYEAEVKDAVDPIYLYMFKKSVEDVPKIGGATLNGAEYEMLFYSKQHFSSAENAVKKGSQTARFDTNRIWHSS